MRQFKTTSVERLNYDSLPMKLYQKAKKFGMWDPVDIDFTQDRQDWLQMDQTEQMLIKRLISMFQAGEEAVTRDLLPLIRVMSLEERLEEEMYLTSFLFEETKHTEALNLFIERVIQDKIDFSVYHQENYRVIFYNHLPQAMERLINDQSPEAQIEAAITYNMIVEGTLAETGYHGIHNAIKSKQICPGLCTTMVNLQRDESRHITYGTFLLQRLISEHKLWDVVENRMNLLIPHALGVVEEIFSGLEDIPFGIDKDEMLTFALKQFRVRMELLEKAQNQTVEQIYKTHAVV